MTGAPARAALVFLVALNLSLAPSGGIAHAAELVQPGYLIAGDTYGYSVSTGGAVVGDSKDAAVGLGTLGGANSQANAVNEDGDKVVGLAQNAAGVTTYLADGLSFGGGLFMGVRSVDTDHGGNQDSNMFGPGAFVNYAPEPTGIRAKFGVLFERVSLELNRGYSNGSGSTVAKGSTAGNLFAMNGHLGWIHPHAAPDIALTTGVAWDF